MRSFKFGSGDTQTFTSGNYVGLDLTAYLQQLNVNVPFAGQPVDFSKLQVKVTLTRNGQDRDIVNENALPLILASGFYNSVFDECKAAGLTPYTRVLQASGAAAKAVGLVAAKIVFPSVINIGGGDQLRVELNSQATALNAANTDLTVSECRWQLIEGVGNAYAIPRIRVKAITGGLSSIDETMGDNVSSIFFINNDKTSVLAADQVVTLAQIMSDKVNRTLSFEQLFLKRAQEMDYNGAATNGGPDGRGQSFCLFNRQYDVNLQAYENDDVRLHKCAVHLNFNAGNLNSAQNWLVWFGFYTDLDTAAKANQRKQKHDTANALQYVKQPS